MNAGIQIYTSDGKILKEVLITKEAKRIEALMGDDYAELCWKDVVNETLPVGAYIEVEGEILRLLDPYEPEQVNEESWKYTPRFQSRVSAWSKTPCFFYTVDDKGAILNREPDWTLTDTAGNAMRMVTDAIRIETGEIWKFEVSPELAGYKVLTVNGNDILSVLNAIADLYETEWRADKEENKLYLGNVVCGEESRISLEVGDNVGIPKVTNNGTDYFNRFYIFGSTRNIPQEYQGANVNNLINKRLTLDPDKYPGGYIDVRASETEPVLPKCLFFDEIYPHSPLKVLEVRPRLAYTLDESGGKIQIGTDSEGTPIYDTYAIWYVQLATETEGGELVPFRLQNTDTYSKDNPDGVLISGKALSIHFEGGSLNGKDFELKYHSGDKVLTTNDGMPFNVKEGDFEILFIKEGDLVIPSVTGLVPRVNDPVVLFNLRMPEEYVEQAYPELEKAAWKTIKEEIESDNCNYEVKSNPVAFYQGNTQLCVGRSVIYKSGDYVLETRVIKIERQLDIPCEQTITLGNKRIKGNIQTLKEDVANAGKDINMLSALSALNQSTIDGYRRAIQGMLEGFDRIQRMWQFDENGAIYSQYDVYSLKGMSSRGYNPDSGTGGGVSELRMLSDVWLSNLKEGQALVYNGSEWINQDIQQGFNKTELLSFLSDNNYAKKTDIPSLEGYASQDWITSQGFLIGHQNIYALTLKAGSFNANTYNPKTAALSVNVPTHTDHLIEGSNKFYTDARVQSAMAPTIETLNGSIKQKLDSSLFNEFRELFNSMFEKVTENGVTSIKAKYGLWSEHFMSVRGKNADGSGAGGGGAFGRLDSWDKYQPGNGDALGANLGWDLRSAVNANAGAISLLSTRVSALEGKEYVTLNTAQEITALKRFKGYVQMEQALMFKLDGDLGIYFAPATDGTLYIQSHSNYTWRARLGMLDINGNLTMNSFVKSGGTASQFLKADGSVDSNSYALASALGSYLPLTGGTLKAGTTITPLRIDTDDDSESGISIRRKGVDKAWFGFSGLYGSVLYSYVANKYLGIKDDGTPHFQGNTLWHAGNDGAGSGLDADLLDGLHSTDFARLRVGNSLMWNDNETVAEWSKRIASIPGFIMPAGWGWSNSTNLVLGDYTIDSQRYTAIDFRNGGLNGFWQQKSYLFLPAYLDSSMIYISQMSTGATAGVVTTAIKRYADYDTILASNVASATRLQGTYSLWGQNFFGNNVSGDMTGVGSISANGRNTVKGALLTNNTFWASDYGHFRAQSSHAVNAYTVGFGASEDGFGLLQSSQISVGPIPLLINPKGGKVCIGTCSTDPVCALDVSGNSRLFSSVSGAGGDVYMELWRGQNASWKMLNNGGILRFQCNYVGSAGSYTDLMTIAYNTGNTYIKGNLGLGTTSAAYKLDVNGTARISGTLLVNADLTATANLSVNGNSTFNGTGLFNGDLTAKSKLRGMDTYVNQLFFSESTTDTQVRPYLSGYSNKFNVAFHKAGVWQKTPLMLDVNGNMELTGVFHSTQGAWSDGYMSARGQNTSSDIRLKKDFRNLDLDIRDIAFAPCVEFRWRKDGARDLGSIAQYFEKINPLFTPGDPEGKLTLQYGKTALLYLIPTAKMVLTHEDRIAALELENKELKEEITRLQTIINN